jgi:hypothetical protein
MGCCNGDWAAVRQNPGESRLSRAADDVGDRGSFPLNDISDQKSVPMNVARASLFHPSIPPARPIPFRLPARLVT